MAFHAARKQHLGVPVAGDRLRRSIWSPVGWVDRRSIVFLGASQWRAAAAAFPGNVLKSLHSGDELPGIHLIDTFGRRILRSVVDQTMKEPTLSHPNPRESFFRM